MGGMSNGATMGRTGWNLCLFEVPGKADRPSRGGGGSKSALIIRYLRARA